MRAVPLNPMRQVPLSPLVFGGEFREVNCHAKITQLGRVGSGE